MNNSPVVEFIDNYVEEILRKVAKHYELKIEEVFEVVYSKEDVLPVKNTKKNSNVLADIEFDRVSNASSNSSLSKLTVIQLKELCKEKGLATTGKKQDIIDRLSSMGDVKPALKEPSVKKPPPILTKIMKSRPVESIRANRLGYLEHPPSRLIFQTDENGNHIVVGRMSKDPKDDNVYAIETEEDVQECEKYGFRWERPKISMLSRYFVNRTDGI